MVWTSESDSPSPPSREQRAQLVRAFDMLGLTLDPAVEKQAAFRLQSAAETEWCRLECPCLDVVSLARAKHLLGAGHVLTEFLISPAGLSLAGRSSICSLGALVNLMVVICDSLLDGGAPVEEVLPASELASGGNGSAVMILLQEYFARLRAFMPDKRVSETAARVMPLMFESEIQTVRTKDPLPFLFWLRKCSLPFVAMALPAWTNLRHLRWLYQIGRLFGVIDDAVDASADLASGHPNYWHLPGKTLSEEAADRVAYWAYNILAFWDSLVPETTETAVVRASFLYNVWRWFEPA